MYRESCRSAADAAGVTGWVRNNDDGSVEAALEGDAAAVGKVLAWMRSGPSRGVVTDVRLVDEAPLGEQGFIVR